MHSKQEAIDSITKGSDDTKFVVRTLAEDEQFIKNWEDTVIGKRIGELHSQYDKDIYELTGIEKEQGEKSYNYNKRVLSLLKSKPSDDESLKAKIAEPQEKLAGDDVSKKEIDGLRKALKEAQDEMKSKLQEKDSMLMGLDIKHNVEKALSKIKRRGDLPELVVENFIETATKSLIDSGKKNEQGEIVFFDKDGEIILDRKTGKPKDSLSILSEILEPIIDTGRKAEGTGGKSDGKGDRTDVLPSDVKTKDDLTTWLAKMGKSSGSKEYMDLYNKFRKMLPEK